MAATKVGRSKVVSGSGIVVTASAYAANDALGFPFSIPNCTPNRGALIANSFITESGSASATIRAHFYTNQPSAITAGVRNIVQYGSGYLGYIDYDTYVSAHGSAGMAQNDSTQIVLYGDAQSRVWVQYEGIGTPTFNAATNNLLLFLGVLQD